MKTMEEKVKSIQVMLIENGIPYTLVNSTDENKFIVKDLEILVYEDRVHLKGDGIDINDNSHLFWKRFNQLLEIK